MKFYPVKASGWFNTDISDELRQVAMTNGIVPYNDVFEPIWEPADIYLAFGGRGGGKSETVADRLINDCLSDEYFKCYYGRKVFEDVRNSCFATIVECLKKRGIEKLFRFSEADNSSMVIVCLSNGNRFIPYGCDKVAKLKSIKDPTHIWAEEMDSMAPVDFEELYPTLRTIRGKNVFFGSFNTYPVYPDHWIIKKFFPERYTGEDKDQLVPITGKKITKIFANFPDNYFIDQEKYSASLMLACGGHIPTYNKMALGEWGVVENKNPWLYCFDEEQHVRDTLPYFRYLPVYLSFDFNNDPFACTAWQFSEIKGDKNQSFIHCIKEFTGKIKIEDMCAQIKATFPNQILYVTGDRSGQNEDLGRNQTLYQMIASLLGIKDKFLKLNNTNLEHADSRVFCNTMLGNYPNLYFSRKGCPQLIKQCGIATVDLKSAKPSQLLKDRGMYKMDEFDSFRYLLQTFFHEYAKNTYLRIHKKK